MSPVLLVLLLLMLSGDSGSKTNDDSDDSDDGNDGAPDKGDTKCPMGAPLIYTGYGFNVDLDDPKYKAAEADMTSQERQVLSATLDALQGDEGFPAPRSGVCLQEDLSAWLKVTKDGKPAPWSSLAGMLAWHMFASPQGPWLTWDEMTLQQRARASRFAAAAKLREQDDENIEEDPPGTMPEPTAKPTQGAVYRVRQGDTLLGLAGEASGYKAGSVARREYAKSIVTHPANVFATRPASVNSFDAKYLGGRTAVLTREYSCKNEVSARGSGDCFPLLYFP